MINKIKYYGSKILFLMIIIGLIILAFIPPKYEGGDEKLNSKIEYLQKQIQLRMEYSYFEGQKDALSNDIRIEEVNGEYIWSKSPWDDNNKTILYNPSLPFGTNEALIK